MYKFITTLIIFIFSFQFSFSQTVPDTCSLQGSITVGLCFDPPGCTIFTAEHTGGQAPYTYLWSNGKTTKQNTYFASTYQGTCEVVTITDAKGCKVVVGRVFDWQTPPSFGLAADTISADEMPTNFDLSANDTIPNLNYELVQEPIFGSITFDINGQGVYTPDLNWCGPDYFRYIAFNNNCNYSETKTVKVFNGPCADILISSLDCNNQCTGSAIFYQQGIFTPPLTFQWSNGSTEESADGICTGEIFVTVTDDLGTSEVFQKTIDPSTLEVTIEGIDQACENSNVILTPQISQSSPEDIDYIWSHSNLFINSFFQHDSILSFKPGNPDSSTNVFQLILYASSGCSDTAFHSIDVKEQPKINFILQTTPIHCSPDVVNLKANVSEGLEPYDYQWIGPMGIHSSEPTLSYPNATSFHNGGYRLNIIDQNGCLNSKFKYLSIPDSTTASVNAYGADETVCRGSDLELYFGITASPFGNPEVEWTGPNGFFSNEYLPVLENVQPDMAGYYTVKVTYSEHCVFIDSTEVMVSPDEAFVSNLEITPPTGCWDNDAQLEVTMSIPPPYDISINWGGNYPNFTTNPFTINNGRDGIYNMEIETANCVIHQVLNIPEPDIPTIEFTDISCLGNDGTATVISPNAPQVSARFQLPDAVWNDYQEGLFVDNLLPGNYSVYIKDSVTNCNFSETVNIPPYLNFDVMVVDTPTCVSSNGTLEILSTGQAAPPISFDWSNNVSGNINSGLETGWYSVTMTDSDDCQRHENVFLPASEPCVSTITGHAFFNYNCECIPNGDNFPYSNLKICVSFGGYSQCFYTDDNGKYTLVAPIDGEYTLTAFPDNGFIQNSCAPQPITIANNNDFTNADFYFCGDTITDLRVDAYCRTARPGFEQKYEFKVSNVGTSFTDTMVSLTVNLEDNLEVFQISPAPNAQNLTTNEFTWNNYKVEFNSFEKFTILATVNAMLGDTLNTTAEIVSNNNDIDLVNDFSKCEQIVVGSYDPNDKTANPLGSGDNGDISAADTMFNYTIRFQNTGTDTAFTVIVRDTLDAEVFDLESVRPRISSHSYDLSVENENILVFLFENINLPDSNRTVEGSQGFVTFDISLKPDLPLGTYIQNTAAIYFDFNEPIITNTTSNFLTFHEEVFLSPIGLKVFPNPASNKVFASISLKEKVTYAQLDLYSMDGKLIKTILPSTDLYEGGVIVPFETSELANGIYFVQLKTEKGFVIEKLVKVRF